MKFQKYDYYLIVLATLVLSGIGVISIYGIAYYNYLAVNPEWTQTIQYTRFVDNMNSYLYPFIVLLLITLGLCIPKRLFGPGLLAKFSLLVLGITVIFTFVFGIEKGLGFILAVMIAVQAIVFVLTLTGSKYIRFEKEGYVLKLGS